MASARVIDRLELPPELEAHEPPEARGLRRDAVRLLVSNLETGSIDHARFADLPRWLSAGDLLVVNSSATVNAALPATTVDGGRFELHLSTRLPVGLTAAASHHIQNEFTDRVVVEPAVLGLPPAAEQQLTVLLEQIKWHADLRGDQRIVIRQ